RKNLTGARGSVSPRSCAPRVLHRRMTGRCTTAARAGGRRRAAVCAAFHETNRRTWRRAGGGRGLRARFVRWQAALDRDDAIAAASLGGLEIDLVADRVPHQRARHRRLERDDVLAVMVLTLAEDPVGRHVLLALEHHLGA